MMETAFLIYIKKNQKGQCMKNHALPFFLRSDYCHPKSG